jgi:multiple sugar transport system substrate-binding protein
MRKMKKILAVLMAVGLLISSLTGCSTPLPGEENTGKKENADSSGDNSTSADVTQEPASSAENGTEEHESVTLKVWGDDLRNNEAFYNLVKETYPWMDIEVVSADTTKLYSMIAAGTAPDVWILSAFHMGCMFAARGLYEPLDDYIANSEVFKNYTFSNVQNMYKFDGERIGSGPTYGIVKDWSIDSQMFINKKVFEEAGLAVPAPDTYYTWDDMMSWAKAIKKLDADGKQTRWSYATTNNMSQQITLQLAQLGSSLYSEDLKSANIDTPEMRKVLEWWKEYITEGGASYGPYSAAPSGFNGLANEEVGMVMEGYWYSGNLKGMDTAKDHLQDFVMIQTPQYDTSNPVSGCLAGVGASIYSGSKHKDEAFKLIELYIGGKFGEDRVKSGWGNPSINEFADFMPQSTDFDKQCFAANQKGMESLTALVTNPYVDAGGVESTFSQYFDEYLFDRISLEDCIKGMEKDYNTMIDEGMDIVGVE